MGVGVGVDPGADGVKVVKVRSGPAGVSILSAVRVDRPAGGGFPAMEVRAAVARAGLPRRVTCGVSGRDLMLRYVAVPPVPPWRLKMLVDFEIRENMAGGGTDISSDYRPLALPTGLQQGLVVLAAIAKNAYLEGVLDQARSAGLEVNAAAPSAVALFRAFTASREFRAGEAVFLLDIGRENMEMAIQKDGELYFARNASGTGGERATQGIDGAFGIGRDRAEIYKRERARITLQPPADPDKRQLLIYGALREAGDAVVSAVSSGLRFARMQTKLKDLDFDRLVLSGGGARLAGLKEFLQKRLEKPVSLFDPAAAMDSSRLRGDEARAFGGAPSEMTVATGLAIMDAERGGFSLSLLPPREAERRRFWSRTVYGYAAGALAGVLAAAMAVHARLEHSAVVAERKRLDGEVGALAKRADVVEALEAGNRRLRDELSLYLEEPKANRAMLDFLKLQRKACPEGIGLRRLKLVDRTAMRVSFEGTARGLDEGAFLAKLEEFQRALDGSDLVRAGSVSQIASSQKKGEADVRAYKGEVALALWATCGHVESEEGGTQVKYSKLRKWSPASDPNGIGLDILLEEDLEGLEENDIVSFVKTLSTGKDPVVIKLFTSRKAYEEVEQVPDYAREEGTEWEGGRGFVLFYVKNGTGRGAYAGCDEIRWMQETGKFAHLFGQKTKM